MILVAIAVIGCGIGDADLAEVIIFGMVMTVRQAQQEFQTAMEDVEWQSGRRHNPSIQEYNELRRERPLLRKHSKRIDSGLESYPDSAVCCTTTKLGSSPPLPDEAVRDGELAVEHGTKACDLTSWN